MVYHDIEINLPGAQEVIDRFGLGAGGKGQMFFTNELLRISDAYTPFDIGTLKNTATIGTSGDFIQYNTVYARRLWYGDGFNFKGAPIRGSRWVSRAFMDNQEAIIKSVEDYIVRGG